MVNQTVSSFVSQTIVKKMNVIYFTFILRACCKNDIPWWFTKKMALWYETIFKRNKGLYKYFLWRINNDYNKLMKNVNQRFSYYPAFRNYITGNRFYQLTVLLDFFGNDSSDKKCIIRFKLSPFINHTKGDTLFPCFLVLFQSTLKMVIS